MIEIGLAVRAGMQRETARRLAEVERLQHKLEAAKRRTDHVPGGLRSGGARA